MKKKIILIVGKPGSGKSLAKKLIAKHFKAKTISSGDIVRQEIQRRGLKYSPLTDMVIAHWFHSAGREIIIVEKTWQKLKRARTPLIVIEGFRSIDQLKLLEDVSGIKPIIISIKANQRTRIKRELERKRFGKAETLEYIKKRDVLEKSHGLDKLMRKAKYKVDNNKTQKHLEKKLISLVKKINK